MLPAKSARTNRVKRSRSREAHGKSTAIVGPSMMTPSLAAALEEARLAGLFDGEKSEHVSFRAPPALVEAAKRESGVQSTSELGILALAALAQPDPVAAFFRRTRGRLGRDHQLDY